MDCLHGGLNVRDQLKIGDAQSESQLKMALPLNKLQPHEEFEKYHAHYDLRRVRHDWLLKTHRSLDKCHEVHD